MTLSKKILLVEDDEGLAELIPDTLRDYFKEQADLDQIFEVVSLSTAEDALIWLKANPVNLLLLDYSLSDMNGAKFVERMIKEFSPVPPFIVTTGVGDERLAVPMMKQGARDYLVKDAQFLTTLPPVVMRVLRENDIQEKLHLAEKDLKRNQRLLAEVQKMAHIGGWEISHLDQSVLWTEEAKRLLNINSGEDVSSILSACKESFNKVLTNCDATGTIRHLHLKCDVQYENSDTPVRSIGTV